MPMTDPVRLIVVMGVSGAGKSTVGEALARALGYPFIDADHLHTPEAIAKMRGGRPLEDADRWPWLRTVGEKMTEAAETAGGAVCACSALRRAYRDALRGGCREPVLFVLLHGDREVIAQRQANRPGHFMPPSLLDSQFATLETFAPDETGLVVDVAQAVDAQVEEICAAVQGVQRSTA